MALVDGKPSGKVIDFGVSSNSINTAVRSSNTFATGGDPRESPARLSEV
jgi:hypothetical protein